MRITSARRKDGTGHLRGTALLLATVPLAGCASVQSISNTHGPAAHSIEMLSRAMTITFLAAVLVMWVLVAWAAKRRSGSLEEHMPIDVGGGNSWIAIGGLGVPLIVLSVFLFLGLQLLAAFPIHGKHQMSHGPSQPAGAHPNILIIGHQWWWEVHYLYGNPGQQFVTANEIHIPVNQPVNIELESADVIHSFWVPSLHGKVDMVPGHPNFIRIEASDAGDFSGQCAEYCGKQHAHMRLVVVAQPAAEFAEWLAQQRQPGVAPADPETEMGRQAFITGPCSKCHTVRGTPAAGRFGPDLTHIGSRLYIGADSFPNNNGYLEGWVTNAQGMKPGCLMPDIRAYNGTQLRALVRYLRQLQ